MSEHPPDKAIDGDDDLRARETRFSSSGKSAGAADGIDLTEKTLGDFRVLRRIGRGGMAEVYLAQQLSLNRNVALKILRPDLVTDELHLKRFRTEALAVAALNHPNIILVYSVGNEDGIEYIAQEYVQGYNLRQFLVRKGPPDLPVALRIMKQIASALSAAGQAGIVHRDIKPENILITRKGKVKVADFGLAQLTLQGERVNLTQVGTTMGTPLYMSPEQVNGSQVTPASDIYSFGVTAYHMLSGSPPFRGETAMSIAVQHINDEPAPLEEARPELPILLCRIVHQMMAKDVKDRYRTADAVLKDLKRVAQAEEGAGGSLNSNDMPTVETDQLPLGEPSRITSRIITWSDRPFIKQIRPWLIAVILFFAVGFGVGWLVLPSNPLSAYTPTDHGEVEKQADVQSQFFHAMKLGGTEAAWKKVIDAFPEDEIYRDTARRKLAELYLATEQYSEAEQIFRAFRTAPNSEPEKRAFGHAGIVVLLCHQGDYEGSLEEYNRFLDPPDASPDEEKSLTDYLHDPMRTLLEDAVRRNHEKMKKNVDDGLKIFDNQSTGS